MTTITFHRLYQKIDEEARSAIMELLESMSHQLRFELGADLHVVNDDATVFARCVRMDEQRLYYAGVVLAGVPAGPEVADIPWRLRSGAGREIGQGVTGTGGHFGFSVSKRLAESSGPVRLWFGQAVAADPRRAPQSVPESAVLEMAGIFEMFRRANADREDDDDIEPIVAPALRTLDDAKYDAWQCEAAVNGTLGAFTADDGPWPPRRGWSADSDSLAVEESGSESRPEWVAIRGDRIRVRAPAELVPYGVVRIVAKEQDLLVGTCLLPLIKYQTVRSNLWPLGRVVGERDLRTVRWYAQPATDETLPWFSADEVVELLTRSDVQDYEELRGKVEELLALVRQQEGASE